MRYFVKMMVFVAIAAVAFVGCKKQEEGRSSGKELKQVKEKLQREINSCEILKKDALKRLDDKTRELAKVSANSDGRLKDLQTCHGELKTAQKDGLSVTDLEKKLKVAQARIAELTGDYSETELGKKGEGLRGEIISKYMELDGNQLTRFVSRAGVSSYAKDESVKDLWGIHYLRNYALTKALGPNKAEVFDKVRLEVGRYAILAHWKSLCEEQKVAHAKGSPLWAAILESFRLIEAQLGTKPEKSFSRYMCRQSGSGEKVTFELVLPSVPGESSAP